MKKLLFSAVIFSAMLISAAEVPLFPAEKKSTQVTHAAVETAGDNHKIAFKLASGTAEDFAIGSIYVFVDQDPKTGRKGIGNEYFIDIAKAMISSYAADGKGTLHRKAVSAKRSGDWYILSVSSKFIPADALKEFEMVFNVKNKRDRIVLRGIATEKVQIPADK